MVDRIRTGQGEKGLSSGLLAVVFLIGVGVCAVFFSLGFLVGYNEVSSKAAPVAESVTAPSASSSTVNPKIPTSEPEMKEVTTSSGGAAAEPPPAPSEPLPESKPSKTAGKYPGPVALPQFSSPQSSAPSREVGMGLTVQVAATRAKQDAEALVKILKGRRYPVFLVTPERANAGDNLFRVQVGPFTSLDDAEKVRARLAQEGFKPFVRR